MKDLLRVVNLIEHWSAAINALEFGRGRSHIG